MKQTLFAFASAVLLLTACNSNEEEAFVSRIPADGVIRVTTHVDNLATTRAGVETDNLSDFYFDVKHPDDNNYCYTVKMTKDAQTSAWESDKQMLWKDAVTAIAVTAAHLGDHVFTTAELQGTAALEVAADQSATGGASVTANDLVAMPKTTVNPASSGDPHLTTDGKIRVALQHMLSKLTLTVTLGTEFNEAVNGGTATNPITAISIDGTKLKYTFNAGATGNAYITVPATNNAPVAVIPAAVADGYTAGNGTSSNAVATYECILVPQSVAQGAFSVSMTIKGKTYVWTSEATEGVKLASGSAYTLDLIVGKEVVVVNGLSAGAWGDGTSSSDTSLGTDYYVPPVNYKNAYTMADYYQWDAVNPVNATEGNGYHSGTNVTAEYSCKSCPTAQEMVDYLMQGWYWDDGTVTQDGLRTFSAPKSFSSGKETIETGLHQGIWLKKKATWDSNITSNTDWTTSDTFTSNSEAAGYKGLITADNAASIRISDDYFFLPAAGEFGGSSFYDTGSKGYYWSCSSVESSSNYAYSLVFENASAPSAQVKKWEYSAGFGYLTTAFE